MDLTESIIPKSDQLDATELLSGPRVFTIERVSAHNAEQPFNFHLIGFPRVWRPGKSMRRVIVAAWGSTAVNYIGKSIELYCDPSVDFGGVAVGGTRISRMSGIDKPLKVPLLIKRGKSAVFTVQPLPDAAPARDWLAELTIAASDIDAVASLGAAASAAKAPAEIINAIRARWTELQGGTK